MLKNNLITENTKSMESDPIDLLIVMEHIFYMKKIIKLPGKKHQMLI